MNYETTERTFLEKRIAPIILAMRSVACYAALLVIGCVCNSCSRSEPALRELEQANFLEQHGKLEEAVAACTRALAGQTRISIRLSLLNKRSLLRSELKQYDAALADADEAVRVNSESYIGHACRGIALEGMKRYHDAVEAYTNANAIEPRDPRVLFNRARTHYTFGFTSLATQDFSAAIDLNRNESTYYYYRASVYYDRGEYEQALVDLQQYLRLVQAAFVKKEVYALYGGVLYSLSKYKEADENFRAAAQLHAKTPAEESAILGGFYLQVWDSRRALALYDQAVGMDPTNATFHLDRAGVKYSKGDIHGANQDVSQAIELGQHEADAYALRGWLRKEQGQYDLAQQDYEQALTLDSQRQSGSTGLGDVAMLQSNKVAALEAYQRGLAHSTEKAELALRYMMLGGVLSKDIRDYLLQFSSKSWPYPLIHYYLDRMTEEEVLALAEHPKPVTARAQKSEAWFYFGAKRLSKKEPASAQGYFQKAAECDHCPDPSDWFLAQRQLETGFLNALLADEQQVNSGEAASR